jgi:long-subunit acyl-CoA synthetase (AMP-forming)
MLAPSTGELCYRGRHIFMGYMYMPDKTAETIDAEGYLHSGDIAELDDDVVRVCVFVCVCARMCIYTLY